MPTLQKSVLGDAQTTSQTTPECVKERRCTMKAVLWILSILSLAVLGTWLLYQPVTQPAAAEVASSQKTYIPAYNGTSLPDTPRQPKMEMLSVMTGVLLFLGLMLFFTPMFLACHRDHPNAVPITLVNVLLGWTFLGWVVALVWSCSATSPRLPHVDTPRATAMTTPTPHAVDYY